MKKTINAVIVGAGIIGLGLNVGLLAQSLPDLAVQTQSVTTTTTLPSSVAGDLMLSGKVTMTGGQIRVIGTNVMVVGMASFTLPVSQFGAIVSTTNLVAMGYDPTNFYHGTFKQTTNGFVVNAEFRK